MDALLIYQRKTGETPPALQNKPEDPAPDVEFFLQAFFFLSNMRTSNGFGADPLSYLAVADYADRVGYSQDGDFFFFVEVMQALDNAYLKHVSETQRSKQATKPAQPRPKRR